MSSKIVLILGATRGIGRALVGLLKHDLGDRGTVYFTARSEIDAIRVETEFLAKGIALEGGPAWVNTPSKVDQVGGDAGLRILRPRVRPARASVAINSANPGIARTEATAGFIDTVSRTARRRYLKRPRQVCCCAC